MNGRWTTTGAALCVLVVGCGSGQAPARAVAPPRPSSSATASTYPAPALTVMFTLPSTTLVTGSSVMAAVSVVNTTGQPVSVTGCLTLFGVAVRSAGIPQSPSFNACRQNFTISAGQSTYTAEVAITYLACSQGPPQGALYPSCVGGNKLPDLPPGKYEVALDAGFEIAAPTSIHLAMPPPIPITVTARS